MFFNQKKFFVNIFLGNLFFFRYKKIFFKYFFTNENFSYETIFFFYLKGKLTNCHQSGCERPFSVQKIPHSNLILLVVDTLCPCGSKQLDIEPQEVPDGAGKICKNSIFAHFENNPFNPFLGACGARRLSREKLERKRPSKCINYHPEEIEIQQCATATTILLASSKFLSIFSSLISFIIMLIFTSSNAW